MHKFDFRREHLVQPVAKDRVRVPAADFHDLQRTLAASFDAFDELTELFQ
jgi:hypothetical protein